MVEFAIALPVIVFTIFGTIDMGTLMWAQFSLQHSVEMAARCATISTNNPQATQCTTTSNPSATTSVQYFAANQYWGPGPAPTYTVSLASAGNTCGKNGNTGNQVSGTYISSLLGSALPGAKVTITAQSCYPSPT